MYIFLLNYRATPHATTGASPALLHLGREVRTEAPQVEILVSDILASTLQNAKSSDSEARQKMARYTDLKKKAKPSMVKVGDNLQKLLIGMLLSKLVKLEKNRTQWMTNEILLNKRRKNLLKKRACKRKSLSD